MNTPQKPSYVKLSELIKPGKGSVNKSCQQVAYSWHLTGDKSRGSGALAIYFNEKSLREIRYRDGDRIEISIGEKEIVFDFGAELPFSVYGHKNGCKNRMAKCSSNGIEVMKERLPDMQSKTELEIVSMTVGRIICKLPS